MITKEQTYKYKSKSENRTPPSLRKKSEQEMRHQLEDAEFVEQLYILKDKLFVRLQEKGHGISVSTHEIVGILEEEMREVWDALRENNNEGLYQELLDVAVACLLGMASLKSEKMDW